LRAEPCNFSAVKLLRKICGIPFPIAVLIALVLAYAVGFGKATRVVWAVKKEAASSPRLSMVPVPLSDTLVSQEKGATENFFGYQFEVPWQGGEQKQRDFIAFVFSKSGQEAVSFFDPASERGPISVLSEVPELKPALITASLASLYGRENVQSNYDFVRASLNTSPSQLSLILPGRKEVYAANLLLMKEALIPGSRGRLYAFEFGHIRGFQDGDPARDKNVEVEAYDADDRKFQLIFSSKSGPNGGMTQPNINRVLQTLRAAPTLQQ
jgi:hypothetical protein